MTTVTTRITKEFGKRHRYFTDPKLQQLYEAMLRKRGTKLVTKEALAVLDYLGVEDTEAGET